MSTHFLDVNSCLSGCISVHQIFIPLCSLGTFDIDNFGKLGLQ